MTKAESRKLKIEIAYLDGSISGSDCDEYCIPDQYMNDAELREAWEQGYEDAEEERRMEDDE